MEERKGNVMKRCQEEAEVIVRMDYKEKMAHICVSQWPSMAKRMEKRYGVSRDGRNPQLSARWAVPLRSISFRNPSSGRRLKPPTLPFSRRKTGQS